MSVGGGKYPWPIILFPLVISPSLSPGPQIVEAVGVKGDQLVIPSSTSSQVLASICKNCFVRPAKRRPKFSMLKTSLREAIRKGQGVSGPQQEGTGVFIPPGFGCLLSLKMMKEPVIAEDGNLYGKSKECRDDRNVMIWLTECWCLLFPLSVRSCRDWEMD